MNPAASDTSAPDGIEKAATPSINVDYGHPLYIGPNDGPKRVADRARESWQPVETTRMWDDDFYRLHCTLDPAEPTVTIAASGPQSP